MQTHLLGYPRIGSHRELKKATEQYWAGKINQDELFAVGKTVRQNDWQLQQQAGLDYLASNDFSYYDHVLDMSWSLGVIPERYKALQAEGVSDLDLYFAMARGYQKNGFDITAVEMTKWFDTNYHYLVPEFTKDQIFTVNADKIIAQFKEAQTVQERVKPVLIGPITYLLLGKEKEEGFDKLELIDQLLPAYLKLLKALKTAGVEHLQLDEPFLALDLTEQTQALYQKVYATIHAELPELKLLVATYFEGLGDNLHTAIQLPIDSLHIDLVRAPQQLDAVLDVIPESLNLSLGVVDGRNIWKTDYTQALTTLQQAIAKLGKDRIWVAPSCSLLHSPCDLDLEVKLDADIKKWLAFAKQKLEEIVTLKALANDDITVDIKEKLAQNTEAIAVKTKSERIHNSDVKARLTAVKPEDSERKSVFESRKQTQQEALNLPAYPTTTIGSFPQTKVVRRWRSKFKKGIFTAEQYDQALKQETENCVRWQDEIGLDVIVHGEFERNDMVEYFGERLDGFAFTQFGWVQSYGSRCVKPPIIYGDVARPHPMTVYWSAYAQSLTSTPVKGMLTGPVTILQWSFVRNDQPRSETCRQIALAIRDEVVDLEKNGIRLIQIDEPALREGLPLRHSEWKNYLNWAIDAFKLTASGVEDSTQIHTHMCYSEFNDIIEDIARMDADVITIECSRSQMELLQAFADFNYPNDIGPGVYDIHSPRVPSKTEMVDLLEKASKVIPANQLWVNPDCGLKTRDWEETKAALIAMVDAAKVARATLQKPVSIA